MADPCCDGLPSLLSDLKLHRTPCLYSELHQVAGAKLAVDRQIEQGKFRHALGLTEDVSGSPRFLEAQRRLLPHELALVPGFAMSSTAAF